MITNEDPMSQPRLPRLEKKMSIVADHTQQITISHRKSLVAIDDSLLGDLHNGDWSLAVAKINIVIAQMEIGNG